MLAFSVVMALHVRWISLRFESPLNILGGKVEIWLPAVGHVDAAVVLLCSQSCCRAVSPLNMPVTVPSCATDGVGKDVSRLPLILSCMRLDIPLNMFASSDVIWLRLMDRLVRFTILPLNIFAGREVIWLSSMSMIDKLVRYLIGVCVGSLNRFRGREVRLLFCRFRVLSPVFE